MILKKPYKMLIKNFRKIHIILTLLTIFIAYESSSIITFFREFIANNYSVTVTDNLVSSTIGGLIYVALIVSIGILIAIYVLLRTKKKPNKTYLITIIYYIILFIFIIVAANLIGSLSDGLWSTADSRTYRDFAQLIYYPQYIFIIILAIRALGFNVKQFNFKNDLKELEITDEDNAEIELNINFETYKAERKVRRFIRECKYYYLENKLIFTVISVILVVLFGVTFIKGHEKLKYTYKENKSFSYHNMTINMVESMVTKLDLRGNTIYDDKYFVLVKVKIKNSSGKDIDLDYNNFKLYYGSEYVYPTLDLGNYFLDFGDAYMGDRIKAGEEVTYVIPYMIEKRFKDRNFKIVIYLGASSKNKEKFLAKTATVKLKPNRIGDVERVRTANLNEEVFFSSTLLKDSSFTVKSAEYASRYEYNYQSCYRDECQTKTDVVVADVSYLNRQTLIVMDYDLVLDNSTSSYQNINDLNAFSSSFMEVEYKIGDTTKVVDAIYRTPPKLSDKLILQTDGNILQADEVNLLITIRDRCYVIKLK